MLWGLPCTHISCRLVTGVCNSSGVPDSQEKIDLIMQKQIDLWIQPMNGEELKVTAPKSALGSEVQEMILKKLPPKRGSKLKIFVNADTLEQNIELKLHQTLEEQGLATAEVAFLVCIHRLHGCLSWDWQAQKKAFP